MNDDFRTQLKKFSQRLEQRAAKVVRSTVLQLGDSLVSKSPWGRWEEWSSRWQRAKPMPPYVPGLFKGSWDYDFDAPPSSKLDTEDETGAVSMARISAVNTTPPFVHHFLVNNTEYGQIIEYGGAIHNIPDPTPPTGVVRTTVLEFPDFVAGALRESRKG